MSRSRFLAARQDDWTRFRALLVRVETLRLKQLEPQELSELSQLHRALCYDLSMVRSRDWGAALEHQLNDLVTRSHNLLYRAPPGRWGQVVDFLAGGFPRLLRENQGYFWVAFVLFVGPALAAGILIGNEPELGSRLLPQALLDSVDAMHSQRSAPVMGRGELGMTGFYVRNNVGITFLCFATGILLGLGSAYFLVFNGLFMGAVTGYIFSQGHGQPFTSFVICHGSWELTALVVAGAAGLILGRAVLHPGPYSRIEALRIRGLVAVQLVVGAALMDGIAALIESMWSPLPLAFSIKLGVGLAMWAVMLAYLLLAGRFGREP